jgi:CHASE2 domain-containing sensor protein
MISDAVIMMIVTTVLMFGIIQTLETAVEDGTIVVVPSEKQKRSIGY